METPFSYSYALRACPLVCVMDTSMMLVKFVVMLAVGCSPRTAVRHVWYDRFDKDQDDAVISWIMELFAISRSIHHREHHSIGEAADNMIEPVSSADLYGDSNPDQDEYMCSGGLPVVSDQEVALTDIPLAVLRPRDDSPICRPVRTATIPSIDVAEVGISATEELERPHQKPSVELPNDPPNTVASESQMIDDDTATVAAPSSSPNAFMVTINYMKPPPGSIVDRGWRLSMMSFIFGATPQAIKVFSMRGVPGTQLFVGTYFVAFIVPEIFRSLAGPVGQFNLYPLPIVSNAKYFLSHGAFLFLFWFATGMYVMGLFLCVISEFIILHGREAIVPFGMMLAFPVALLLFWFLQLLIEFCPQRTASYVYDSKISQYVRTNLVAFIMGLFALSSSTAKECLSFVCVYTTCLVGVLWGLWCISLFPVYDHNLVLVFPLMISFTIFAPIISYIAYRILFIGYLSNFIHRLCGTRGTTGEFFKGMFMLLNIATLTLVYANHYSSSSGTFKPHWVEILG